MAIAFVVFLSLFSILSGCSFIQLKEETEILENSTVLVGRVTSTHSVRDTPVIVVAYFKENNKRTITHYTALHEPGPYELMVPKGNCYIAAFVDKDKNLKYDHGEPAGQYLGADPLSVPKGGVVSDLDIVISSFKKGAIDLPVGTIMPEKDIDSFHFTSPGAIANLDDEIFSENYGKKGVMAPLEFFNNAGGNVYFLETYDPEKIPILFVHGIGGSPQDWKAFFTGIDRNKYQPWFFYYPSGSSLDSMSYLLFWKMINLHTKYNFSELYITAHSMGGLVARSFIANYGEFFPSINKFISISTPWGGEKLVDLGVKYAPAVVPSWRDMQPEGEFIKSIFNKEMPPTVKYFLFFGHKGNRNLLRPNNDKAVTLESLLDRRSQKDAQMIYGFNEDHISILKSEQVISQYNAILATEEKAAAAINSGNKLQLEFSFDIQSNLTKPNSILLLRSADSNRPETWVYINPEDSGKEQGPFPSGKYEVSLMAPAFEPEPARIPVTVTGGSVPRIEFSMKPSGTLSGYVVSSEEGQGQAGEPMNPDGGVQMQSITLTGDGIYRNLIPQKEDLVYSEKYLSGTDFAVKGGFQFFGLPAGEYELTINAIGYKSYNKTKTINPGQYESPMIIELIESN